MGCAWLPLTWDQRARPQRHHHREFNTTASPRHSNLLTLPSRHYRPPLPQRLTQRGEREARLRQIQRGSPLTSPARFILWSVLREKEEVIPETWASGAICPRSALWPNLLTEQSTFDHLRGFPPVLRGTCRGFPLGQTWPGSTPQNTTQKASGF